MIMSKLVFTVRWLVCTYVSIMHACICQFINLNDDALQGILGVLVAKSVAPQPIWAFWNKKYGTVNSTSLPWESWPTISTKVATFFAAFSVVVCPGAFASVAAEPKLYAFSPVLARVGKTWVQGEVFSLAAFSYSYKVRKHIEETIALIPLKYLISL